MKHEGQKSFRELPPPVQDTLNFISSHRYLALSKYIDGKIIKGIDWSLVDFTHSHILVSKPTMLPWVMQTDLKDIKSGKIYKLETGTPKPIIIYGSDMYILSDYNFVGSFASDTMFEHYILK